MKRFLIVFYVLCLTVVRAQEPRFITHDIGDANFGVAINTILQDHQSMIWLGTGDGLARYDGIALHYIVLDSFSVPVKVTSLMEDSRGKIWIGTDIGKIYYLDLARKVHFFNIEEGHPARPITSILQDKYGQIWFATYGEGVYVFTGKRLFNLGVDDGLAGNDIYSMSSAPNGEIWMGTDDGINICTFQNEQKEIRHLGLKDGLPDQIITAIKTDKAGNIWIGTFENGVVFFDAKQKKIVKPFDIFEMDEITAFEIFDGSELWIGTRKTGLWRYHPDSKGLRELVKFNKTERGEISDVMTDVEGNIWVAMNEGKLLSAFRPFETLVTDIGEIQTVFCDHNDQLWAGSKKGLYKIEENATSLSNTVRVAPQYDFNITDIAEDRFHNLWLGTLDQGLYLFNPQTGKVKHIESPHLSGNTIMSMDCTEKEIWIATLQGVMSYPKDKNILHDPEIQFDLVSDPWQSNLHFVFQIYVDSKDKAWFATDGNGVYGIDGNKVTQYKGDEMLTMRTVFSICEDHQGHMWFNTADLGLVEFDGVEYKRVGILEGLGNINLASMATTGTGDILMAHNRGIDLMEPDRRHFMYYKEEAGVKEIDPGLNSIATNSKGHVYLSGRSVIVRYYSTKKKLSIHPRTQLTKVSVFERPIDFTIENKFSHNENYISFDYIGLWYTAPKSVNYLYKLEGYDLQWKESKDNVASYSSLPPGTYLFSVKASENRSFHDEPIASYSFVIMKPFWQEHWFIGAFLLSGALVFYSIVKARERRSERQAMMKKDMIESQLQALKAQINPHFLFNSFNTLITIIDENQDTPEVAIEYVEKLSDFFRSILQYRQHETITLEEEWELAQNFGYLLQKRYGENLRLHMDTPPKDAFILPLTLQMLVENAVKHNVITESRPLDVYITMDEEYVTVQNNMQPKSNSEPSTQFGLQSIIRRYNLLSEKKVIIEKDSDFFKVRIPIINQTADENIDYRR